MNIEQLLNADLEEESLNECSIYNIISDLLKDNCVILETFKIIVNKLFMKPHVRNIIRKTIYPTSKNTILYELKSYVIPLGGDKSDNKRDDKCDDDQSSHKYIYLCNLLKDNGVINQSDVDDLYVCFMISLDSNMEYINMLPKPNMSNADVATKVFKAACYRYSFSSHDATDIIYNCDTYNYLIPKIIKRAIKINDEETFTTLFTKFAKQLISYRGTNNNTILLYANFFDRPVMVRQIVSYCDSPRRAEYLTFKNNFGVSLEDNIKLRDLRKTGNFNIDKMIKKPKCMTVANVTLIVVAAYFSALIVLPFIF